MWFPISHIPYFPDLQIPNLVDFPIPGFQILRFPDSPIPRFSMSSIIHFPIPIDFLRLLPHWFPLKLNEDQWTWTDPIRNRGLDRNRLFPSGIYMYMIPRGIFTHVHTLHGSSIIRWIFYRMLVIPTGFHGLPRMFMDSHGVHGFHGFTWKLDIVHLK